MTLLSEGSRHGEAVQRINLKHQQNMIGVLKRLQNMLTYMRRGSLLNSMKIDDTYAMALLRPLTEGRPYLPFTGSAIRPFCLAHIINDIVLNHRQNILEFGTGISTILIARLAGRSRPDCRVISIDHDLEWIQKVRSLLKEEELDDYIHFIHAPLGPSNYSINSLEWYDMVILERELSGRMFDMVVVDGPPAWEEQMEMARYPALPFISAMLDENCTIYLDDANRAGEQEILRRWDKEFGLAHKITGGTMASITKGSSFYLEPSVYYLPE